MLDWISVIRAVLLDAMGTLLTLEPPAPALAPLLPEPRARPEIERAFMAEIAYYRAHMLEGRDRASTQRLRERCAAVIADSLGLEALPVATLEAALRFRVFPDVLPALRAWREASLRLVVVSNWDALLPDALRETGLLPLLDGVVTSGALGVAKPDPRIFDAALEAAGVGPLEAIHIGDSPEEDVVGAQAAGIRGVLLRRAAGETLGPLSNLAVR